MQRRTFMAGAVGLGTLSLSAPLWMPPAAKAAGSKVLRFIPNGGLDTFDPIGTTNYRVRNAAFLVWDTLYGIDENQVPQPQMVESGSVSDDGLVWTFKLRNGLKFHDDTPVTAADAVASLDRWSKRDLMGQMIAAIQEGLHVVDERTFQWKLKSPYPKMLLALGKTNPPCTFIMPERIASTDPFKPIGEYVGSGPMRFIDKEWVPGSKVVFEKFEGYEPRPEPASWSAGGKVIHFDRIEWVISSDPATASLALQNGEVDWVEELLIDLAPVMRSDPGVKIGISNPYGYVSGIRLNHLQPPFTDVRARTALMMAISQDDYMYTMLGSETDMWKHMYSYFTVGSPLYTEAGADVLSKPRDYGAAKELLAQSGYNNEPIVLMVSQEQASQRALGEVTADLLTKKLGMNLDYVATDSSTIQKRRMLKTPASEGGWHMFFVGHSGTDCANPAAYIGLRANGEKAWFGWPDSPEVEAGITEWFNAPTPEAEIAAAEKINTAAMRDVVFALTGFYSTYTAWRSELSGVTPAPFPMFWGVERTAA